MCCTVAENSQQIAKDSQTTGNTHTHTQILCERPPISDETALCAVGSTPVSLHEGSIQVLAPSHCKGWTDLLSDWKPVFAPHASQEVKLLLAFPIKAISQQIRVARLPAQMPGAGSENRNSSVETELFIKSMEFLQKKMNDADCSCRNDLNIPPAEVTSESA